MADFVYSGGVRFDDAAVADVTMDKDGHPLTCKNPITGEEINGGGESDFDVVEMVANITVTGADPGPFPVASLSGILIDDNGWLRGIMLAATEKRTVKVPLYHQINDTIFSSPQSSIVETFTVEKVSGDVTITQDEEGYAITVEGNCEININATIKAA